MVYSYLGLNKSLGQGIVITPQNQRDCLGVRGMENGIDDNATVDQGVIAVGASYVGGNRVGSDACNRRGRWFR